MSDTRDVGPEGLQEAWFQKAEEELRKLRERIASLLEDKKKILQERLGFFPEVEIKIPSSATVWIDTRGINAEERAAGRDPYDISQLPRTKEQMGRLEELFVLVNHRSNDTSIVLYNSDLIKVLEELQPLD